MKKLLFVCVYCMMFFVDVSAQNTFDPSTITVTNYVLDPDFGFNIRDDFALCADNKSAIGCTKWADRNSNGGNCDVASRICTPLPPDKQYPYLTSTITIPFETTYLLNVIAQEMGLPGYNKTARYANAIAARTYALNGIPDGIDNSTSDQVFLPNAFDALLPDYAETPPIQSVNSDSQNLSSTFCEDEKPFMNKNQVEVCNAVMQRFYMSLDNNSLPLFAEFHTDSLELTVAGGEGLVAVDDPISIGERVELDGHGRGLSQKGASRWGYGSTGSQYADDLDFVTIQVSNL